VQFCTEVLALAIDSFSRFRKRLDHLSSLVIERRGIAIQFAKASPYISDQGFESILQTSRRVNGDRHHGDVAICATVRRLVTKAIGASEIRHWKIFEGAVRV
jgi:hypothetical protein